MAMEEKGNNSTRFQIHIKSRNVDFTHSDSAVSDVVSQDEATVQQLSEKNSTGDVQGWIRGCHAWLFEGDLFADVAADPALLRIHATAEEFDPATEEVFVPFQVMTCSVLKAVKPTFLAEDPKS